MKTGTPTQYQRVLSLHKNKKLDADYYATRQREAEERRADAKPRGRGVVARFAPDEKAREQRMAEGAIALEQVWPLRRA